MNADKFKIKKGIGNWALLFSLLLTLLYSCKSRKNVIKKDDVNTEQIESIETEIETKEEILYNQGIAYFLSEYLALKYKNRTFEKYLYVSAKHQRLYLIKNDSTLKKYPISTAKKGIGSKVNSNKTPHGLHTMKRKIGGQVPYGGIMTSRVFHGEIAKILTNKENAARDYVTSRIMWLQGEEPGINRGRDVDSYNRYIYIHGTPEEGYIGEPASHGCIRMKNKDVIELFDLVDEGTPVLILKY